MENTNACIRKYMEEDHLCNIAIRIGGEHCRTWDIFESKEKQLSTTTMFDMASVTKVMATTMLSLMALDENKFSLEDSVGKFFPSSEEKQKITIKHLLTHTMGIGYKSLLINGCNYENVQDYILTIPSDVPIGSETLYSCPGFILLGKILEMVFEKRLDELFSEKIAKKLHMNLTTFRPDFNLEFVNSNLHPSEIGVVNDYNCKFLGGVSGNAGLFSCMEDVDRFAKMLLNFGQPLISREMFETAVKNYTETMSDSRTLGFVYVDEKYAQSGTLFSKGSIGHCGHTGQSVFVDLNKRMYVIILSDATISVHKKYGMENYDIVMKMREDLHNAIKRDLDSM